MTALLYELVTNQLTNPGKLDEPVQSAFDLYAKAMKELDDASGPIDALLKNEEDEEAMDRLKSCELDIEILLFKEGYRLGYDRYIPDENRYYGDADSSPGTTVGSNYGNPPDTIIKKHKALIRCMAELYDSDPHDPELLELIKLTNKIGERIEEHDNRI